MVSYHFIVSQRVGFGQKIISLPHHIKNHPNHKIKSGYYLKQRVMMTMTGYHIDDKTFESRYLLN
ncbi:MAG: hypothetical protein CMP10_10265 [Zetaproteobacteria bacterium]|nr:hypothetical protein [Pseudobdellovibrionaceae bacterium]